MGAEAEQGWTGGLRCGPAMATRKTLEEPRGVLAYLEGELTVGAELAPGAYPPNNERFASRVGRADTASFVLERRMLRRAVLIESDGDGPDSLRFYVAITTVLQIDPVDGGT